MITITRCRVQKPVNMPRVVRECSVHHCRGRPPGIWICHQNSRPIYSLVWDDSYRPDSLAHDSFITSLICGYFTWLSHATWLILRIKRRSELRIKWELQDVPFNMILHWRRFLEWCKPAKRRFRKLATIPNILNFQQTEENVLVHRISRYLIF